LVLLFIGPAFYTILYWFCIIIFTSYVNLTYLYL